ncbi:zinc finger BED domain-containing protein RICESLEEPER 2-like [Lactuca sativa]|uniref:zinc finger BED domain-containing protein RICESLEEPER 2-like n=1 Tax=Lactuca sativa TaxID=4236 RepID=UPI000CD973DC|nr:zinc finger BED domain-containing protein RICESLEEPER 2-like [Lactuca sativa]
MWIQKKKIKDKEDRAVKKQKRNHNGKKEINMDEDYDDALICYVENSVESWVMGSGASCHACHNKEIMINLKPYSNNVRLANGKILKITGIGDVALKTSMDNIEPVICFCPDNIEPYLSAEPAVVMKKAKLDSTIELAVVVAPQDVDLEEDDIDVVDVDVKIEGEEVHVKSERERWSKVWRFFERLPIGNDGNERAKCKRCSKRYICETKTGTGSLRVFKPEKFCELVSEVIVKHDLPFKFVEYEGIREVFRYLNENVVTYTRNTTNSDVVSLFNREKIRLKKLLELNPGRISLTFDLWSSINTDGFLCATCHFIDEEWKLQKRILSFQYMPPPHSGICLTETISTLLTDWGIDKKLFTITLDNASSNDTFVNLLKDGLKAIDEGIVKIRESIKYVKGSQARRKKFIDCVKYVNLNPKTGLRQDVPTRWNATYLMIESALFYRRAFFHLALGDSNYLDCPTHDEWGKLEKDFRFLEKKW